MPPPTSCGSRAKLPLSPQRNGIRYCFALLGKHLNIKWRWRPLRLLAHRRGARYISGWRNQYSTCICASKMAENRQLSATLLLAISSKMTRQSIWPNAGLPRNAGNDVWRNEASAGFLSAVARRESESYVISAACVWRVSASRISAPPAASAALRNEAALQLACRWRGQLAGGSIRT